MPRLSDTMTEGTVAAWLKKVGDKISEGDILAEIETDKATMEFESFNSGTLLYIGIPEGESAPVDSLLAIIGNEGEDISGLLNGDTVSLIKEEKAEIAPVANTQDLKPETTLPKGVVVVTMPRLSDTMTDGTVATWLKKVGDKVAEGDILAEIETDKATMEFESFNAGTLLFVGIQEGESAPVDSVLAIIGPEGTNIAGIAENYKKVGNVTPEASEPVAEKAVEVSNPTSNNQNSSSNPTDRIFASPLAKKIAQDKGINLSQVKGSGENGRIIKEDVARFAIESQKPKVESQPTTKAQGASPVTQFVPAGEKFSEEIKNSQMRKTIAKRLSESIFTAPHFYLTIEIAMDEAMKSRATINTIPDTKVSFNDMVVKACAMALKKHPQVNSQWREDAMIINHHVNIGVAVAVEDGLVVPVLNFTDQMSLTQIGSSVRDLAGKAKTKN
ncbi:pyruvate dehydrogenase [Flavobacterium psychrophilum]|nr:pyruvate dehydrogenase [Flavobacterium psychrophilum]